MNKLDQQTIDPNGSCETTTRMHQIRTIPTTNSMCSRKPHPFSTFSNESLRRFTSPHTRLLTVLFSLLLLNIWTISPSSQEGFDIDKLLEYNSLATCIGQIHKDFEQCNTKGAEKAKTFQIDLGTEWNKRLQCCGMWKLRDCWMKAARVKCSKAQAEQVFKLPHLFLPDLATSCAEYTPESGKCTIPMWLIASVVSGIVILLCTCLCGTVFCIKRLRLRNSRRNNVHRVHRKRATSNGGQTHQLVPSLNIPNGKAHLNGKSRTPNGVKNGGLTTTATTTPSQPYLNGAAKVTINIEDATAEEFKSLNGSATKAQTAAVQAQV